MVFDSLGIYRACESAQASGHFGRGETPAFRPERERPARNERSLPEARHSVEATFLCYAIMGPMVKPRASQTRKQAAATSEAGGYWAGSHTLHRLRFHLVWTPKYRHRVLEGAVAARLTELLRQACQVKEWQLHELSIQPDHVHLLVQVLPTNSVSYVLNILKGGTSRVLRKEFPELEEFLWHDSFWGDGYFAETVGQKEEAVLRAYIRNQGKKPAKTRTNFSKKPGTFRV